MAAGLKVALHDEHELQEISRAMFAAGVAVPYQVDSYHGKAHATTEVDGRGAVRLLEALL
jgi:hypothetical protein